MAGRELEKGYWMVDPATGELSDFEIIFRRRRRVGGKWVRFFQAARRRMVVEHPELTGETLRVMVYLEGVVGWGNVVPGTREVARGMGIQQSQASRSYASLVQVGYLIKEGSSYMVNPLMAWKGNAAGLEVAIRALMMKPLPSVLLGAPAAHVTV